MNVACTANVPGVAKVGDTVATPAALVVAVIGPGAPAPTKVKVTAWPPSGRLAGWSTSVATTAMDVPAEPEGVFRERAARWKTLVLATAEAAESNEMSPAKLATTVKAPVMVEGIAADAEPAASVTTV